MITLNFLARGTYLPSDHNYGLYASLIHFSEALRCLDWQLGTITGYRLNNGLIQLGNQSTLSIRCQEKEIEQFVSLNSLTVGKWQISLSTPTICHLQPANYLSSRIVVIKGCETEFSMMRSLLTQSQQLGINASFAVGARKTIKIKQFTVVGFEVMATLSSDQDSIRLQESGLGGKRKMGCGVFCA